MNEHVVGAGAEPDLTNAKSHEESDAALRGVIDEYMSTFEPEPENTAGLRDRILQLVRDDLYLGPSTQLQTRRGHPFSMSTASVRSIVRIAVDSVDGIRARSVEIEPAGDPEGSEASVRLTIAMRAGVSFAPTAEVIRGCVSAAVLTELGIPAVRIDITAEDVYVD